MNRRSFLKFIGALPLFPKFFCQETVTEPTFLGSPAIMIDGITADQWREAVEAVGPPRNWANPMIVGRYGSIYISHDFDTAAEPTWEKL